jgi:hypothetical protein
MNFDIRPLFAPSYWLTFDPPTVWSGPGRWLVLVFLGMIVASVVVRRMRASKSFDRKRIAVYRRIASLLSSMGLVGLVLFFSSFEEIRLFGARFLYLFWIAGTAWWAVRIVRFAKKNSSEELERERERNERERYFPKAKR